MDPDPELPMNANFINDGIDFEAFLKVMASSEINIFDSFEIADDPTKANAHVVYDDGHPSICFSKVKIRAGEEITVMYGSNYWFYHIMNNPRFIDEARAKSLLMLWTEYEHSPAEIPLKKARWIDYLGRIRHTPDIQDSFGVITRSVLELMWKDITKTFMRCFAYLGIERSEPADDFITLMLQTWHKIMDKQAMVHLKSHLTSANLTIDRFWFSVDLIKRQSR